MSRIRRAASAVVVASLLALAACDHSRGGSTVGPPMQAGNSPEAIVALPLGDIAGATPNAASVPNPYRSSPEAAQQGQDLFVKMNCAGCHGYGAKGGMGPNLTDTYWRYGGTPVLIFKSIYEGRPQGMPAWNPALPPEEIWKLTAYIESLGGAYQASQTQAAMQGDRVGDNVAPGVQRTIPASASASGPQANGKGASTSSAEARPDAGGSVPTGAKP
jgi:cytochrome c oxidase cbb3-type subunit III